MGAGLSQGGDLHPPSLSLSLPKRNALQRKTDTKAGSRLNLGGGAQPCCSAILEQWEAVGLWSQAALKSQLRP